MQSRWILILRPVLLVSIASAFFHYSYVVSIFQKEIEDVYRIMYCTKKYFRKKKEEGDKLKEL